jgi:hypothetical protein
MSVLTRMTLWIVYPKLKFSSNWPRRYLLAVWKVNSANEDLLSLMMLLRICNSVWCQQAAWGLGSIDLTSCLKALHTLEHVFLRAEARTRSWAGFPMTFESPMAMWCSWMYFWHRIIRFCTIKMSYAYHKIHIHGNKVRLGWLINYVLRSFADIALIVTSSVSVTNTKMTGFCYILIFVANDWPLLPGSPLHHIDLTIPSAKLHWPL